MGSEYNAQGNSSTPPSLRKGEYQMWRNRFLNFLEHKENSSAMLESLLEGPAELLISVGGDPENNPPIFPEIRRKVPSEYTEADKLRLRGDLMAKTYLLQAIPNEVYVLIDSMQTAKEMWDEIEKLLQGTSISLKTKKTTILIAYDSFKAGPGEPLNETYNRLVQLVNELRKIKVFRSNLELNIRFLSSLHPAWEKTVKDVRSRIDLDEIDLCTLYEHLKQFVNEVACAEDHHTTNPLALVMDAQPRRTTTSLKKKKKKVVVESDDDESDDDKSDLEAELADLQKKMALLAKRFAKKNTSSNRLRTSSSNYKQKNHDQGSSRKASSAEEAPKCYNCGKPGHVIKDCRLPKKKDANFYKQKMLWNKQKMLMVQKEEETSAMIAENENWAEDSSEEEEEEDNYALMASVEGDEIKGDAAIPESKCSTSSFKMAGNTQTQIDDAIYPKGKWIKI
ncbi:unnamed protein product [Cuscuta europaea]|uniref:CCHC-type domain-containing protein n=1 Tax=Cuscuta europaea TaxID=41803 RepID=A0A9P0YUB5_CUSEU|nr:unnamed protein product [Cuscuta europaea]